MEDNWKNETEMCRKLVNEEIQKERMLIETECRVKFVTLDLESSIDSFWEEEKVNKIFSDAYSQMSQELEEMLSKSLGEESLKIQRDKLWDYSQSKIAYIEFVENVKYNRIVSLYNSISRKAENLSDVNSTTGFITCIREQFKDVSDNELNEISALCESESKSLLKKYQKEIYYAECLQNGMAEKDVNFIKFLLGGIDFPDSEDKKVNS